MAQKGRNAKLIWSRCRCRRRRRYRCSASAVSATINSLSPRGPLLASGCVKNASHFRPELINADASIDERAPQRDLRNAEAPERRRVDSRSHAKLDGSFFN